MSKATSSVAHPRQRFEKLMTDNATQAQEHIARILDPANAEGDTPVAEMTTRSKAALTVGSWSAAQKRADTGARAMGQLGIVVVVPQLPAPQWEQLARAESMVIDVPAEPVEDQDGDDVSEGAEAGDEADAARLLGRHSDDPAPRQEPARKGVEGAPVRARARKRSRQAI